MRREPDDYSEYTILITSYHDDNPENSAIAYNSLWFDEFETKRRDIPVNNQI